MSASRTGALAVAVVVVLMTVSSCGSGGLTPAQVRARATRICDAAADRTAHIRLPADPSGGPRFLESGIAALAPEVRALRALGDHGILRTAVTAMTGELAALRSSRKGLRAGNDPVVAIKTLEQQLIVDEQRANVAWRTLKVPSCVTR